MSVEAGMRALLARREAELAAGAEPVGWKVGFNFPQLWPQLGIDAPVAGSLTSATVLEPGAPIRLDGWTRPLLEPEVAIHVAEEGGVAALAPAVELIDADLPFENLEAILARNIFHRGVLLGPADPARTTLEGFHCRVTKNGQQVAVAEESEDPAATLAHVAGFLSAHGARLRPGERVIAGSLTPPVPVAPGDEVRVEIAPLGAVELRFAG
jgi:2-keto-4-pentenoate hydratase